MKKKNSGQWHCSKNFFHILWISHYISFMIQHFPFHLFTVIYGEITQGLCRLLEHKVGWTGKVSPSVNTLLFRTQSRRKRSQPGNWGVFLPPFNEGLSYSGIFKALVLKNRRLPCSWWLRQEPRSVHIGTDMHKPDVFSETTTFKTQLKSPLWQSACYKELDFFLASATWLEWPGRSWR